MNYLNINQKNLNLNYILSKSIPLLFIIILFLITSCNNTDECGYIDDCVETCEILEDFEDEIIGTPGNWLGINTRAIDIITRSGSQQLFVKDGSGGSYVYNDIDFPKNLLEQGCALLYDVEYLAGNNNNSTTDNSIGLYSGSDPVSASPKIFFEINSANAIISGDPPKTIEIPLEMASGNSLPSNSYGSWVIIPSTSPTADVTAFNNLIQNFTGVYFFIDDGKNPIEEWWFDNFCFKQCCPNP